jgi:mRNA-degrading endonuclease toxin of MazEF toxin-antitoxin module
MENKILKYDIWIIDLEPTKWNEQSWIRPCVVIQNDEFFNYQWTTLILPITWNIKKDSNFWVLLENYLEYWLSKESFIISFQIRTVSKERFIKKIWEISDTKTRQKINTSLAMSLDLEDDFIY